MSKVKILFSVIIILIVITGCGIPNYFYLGSGYYRTNVTVTKPTETDKTHKIDVNITLNDTFQTSKCVDCPSAVIFYWIDKVEEPVPSVVSGISSAFSSKFKKNEPSGGVPITLYQDDQESPVIDTYNYKETTSSGSDENNKVTKETPYNLYYVRLFDSLTGQEKIIKSPTFHAQPNASSGATSISFSIQMSTDNTNIDEYRKIYLEQNGQRYEIRRFNGISFKDIPKKEDFATYGDYSVLADEDTNYAEGDSLYVHFMIAFCAAKGNFNNIFWSSLYSSGSSLTLPIYMKDDAAVTTP